MCALGLASVSPASAAYPPAAPLLTTPTPTSTAGAQLTLTATGFVPDAVVTFRIAGTSLGTAVADASGAATLVASSPSAPGTYTVTASSPNGDTASLTLTVVAAAFEPPLPATGSDSIGLSRTAGALVLLGLASVGAAAMLRRRRVML
jgi:hypothetical protein